MEDEKPPVEENNISLQSLEMTMTLEEERERTSDYDGSHNFPPVRLLKYLVPPSLILFRRLYSDRLDCYSLRYRIPMLSAHYYCVIHRNPMFFHVLLPRSDYEIVDTVTDETKRTDPTPHYIDVIHTTNQETYPPKADYASITTVDSTEVNNRQQDDNLKQDGYMETKHEESASKRSSVCSELTSAVIVSLM
jgi:hypothetical protein